MSAVPIDDIADWADARHARWGGGLGSQQMYQIPTGNMQRIVGAFANQSSGNLRIPISTITHPLYERHIRHWDKWRIVYEAGDLFVDEFLRKFSRRETNRDFNRRREMTPTASFASSAIDEIKNSIFQRLGDTTRTDGSETYNQAITGKLGGVNLKGATIDWFIGHQILPELLVMAKVGVYVDAPNFGATQADKGNKHPYFNTYRAEDIRSWTYATDGSNNEFSSLLLREYKYIFDQFTGLPTAEVPYFRHLWIDPTTKYVNVQLYDRNGQMEGLPLQLGIKRIPFVLFEITQSLMKNVANSQISVMNMESSDLNYILISNYPLYVEQYDGSEQDPYVRRAQSLYQEFGKNGCPPGAATVEGVTGTPQAIGLPPVTGTNIDSGNAQGRRYGKGMDAPQFIAPSAEPMQVSMEKQQRLKDDIRTIVHLTLASVQSRSSSAESKLVDRQQGLESGLASIGLELEHGERLLAEYWAMYEGTDAATVIYPDHWSIKSVDDLATEIDGYQKVRDSIPSNTLKREINKLIADLVVSTRVPPDVLIKIKQEIDAAKGGSSDPKTINSDVENGILGPETAAELRGYPKDEVAKAQAAHADRLARIAAAQSGKAEQAIGLKMEENSITAARGVSDGSADPATQASLEKQGKPGRGEAQ